MRWWALAFALWLPGIAFAQPAPARDPEVAQVLQLFEYGKYADVLKRAQDRIDAGGLTEQELAELHQAAGLAAFNLDRQADAARHLSALLRLDPDRTLDPFVYPPPAIHYFEGLKGKLAPELEVIRREQRIASARQRSEQERLAREREQAENQRRSTEAMTRKMTVRTVEKRSLLLNFVPFGVGQFQQGRVGLGTLLATSEGLLAIASIVGFFADASLYTCQQYTSPIALQGPNPFPTTSICGIPQEHALEGQIWRTVKVSAGIGFYAVYAYGVVDALYHHQSEVVTTREVDVPPPPPPAPTKPGPAGTLGLRPFLFPATGGGGAGFSFHF